MASSDNQEVALDFTSAIKHLSQFMEIRENEKDTFILKFQQANKIAVFKLLKYRTKYGVDMEKEELLRDVVFIGTSLVEASSNNFRYYKSVVKACLAIVEIETQKSFEDGFSKKLLKAMNAFQCNNGVIFSSEAFYFVFKTHFRLN
ncbi:MAG: hypothetical protein WCW84_11340 [Sulfurimonas sp.]